VQWPKRAKPCQLPSFYNFASSKISPTVKHDIQKVFHLTSSEQWFVSYKFSRFNTVENVKSQTICAFRVSSNQTRFRNHVSPLVGF
jgi:N-acetylglutamate synthase-like GNAT family acetyltransferase